MKNFKLFIYLVLTLSIFNSCAFSSIVKKPISKPQGAKVITTKEASKTPVVILPHEFINEPVVVEDTPEYQDLLSHNDELTAQVIQDKKNLDDSQKNIDSLLIQKDQLNKQVQIEAAKYEQESKWHKILAWGLGSLGILIPIAVIALCIFFPALIPAIFNIFVSIIHQIATIFSYVFKGLESAVVKIESYKKTS